jgi:hypothetical protein
MTIQEHRQELKSLSKQLKNSVSFPNQEQASINEELKNWYSDNSDVQFLTLEDWNAQGYYVKKGSKAFPFWGKPTLKVFRNPKDPSKILEIKDFYPIVLKFSSEQVEKGRFQDDI